MEDLSKEGLKKQCHITPYRAHAHKRYSSMNRVPENDSLTFVNQCILNRVTGRVRVRVRVTVRVRVREGLGLHQRNAPIQNALVYISFCKWHHKCQTIVLWDTIQ